MPCLTTAILVSTTLLTAAADPVPAREQLRVELLRYPEDRSLFHRNPVLVRFTNSSNRRVTLLRPLDGSEWSWHMPFYRFTVTDEEGRSPELMTRCGSSGLWGNMEWPNEYLIRLFPGDSYEIQVGIPHAIPAAGEYRVTFEYVYDPAVTAEAQITYPEGLWSGTLRSQAITLNLKGEPTE